MFVDVTGRRHRRVRRWGVLVATGSLVYLPLVAAAVLPGPTAPSAGMPPDGWSRLTVSDQPPAAPEAVDVPLSLVDTRPGGGLPFAEPDPPDREPALVEPTPDQGPDPRPPVPPALPGPGGPTTTPSPASPDPTPVSPTPPATPPSPSAPPPATNLLDALGRLPA